MANKDDYLVDYSKFFKNFAETLNPNDPLPVKLGSYKLLNTEVVGAVIDWTTQYLYEKNCPKSLLAPLISITIRKTRESCKLDPRACGFNVSDNAYEPLKLMQSVMARCNEICSIYLDNSLLCSLPPPNALYHRHPVSVCAVKNGRRRMEDRHVVIHDLNTILNLQDVTPSSYFAVFDGHAGHDAAVYSATHLHQYLAESEHFANNPEMALTEAFCKTDHLFVQKCEVEFQYFSSGTTAVCALLRPQEKYLYVAWAGDSMALIANKGRILQCVIPHKPGRKDEQDRIEAAGGSVTFWGTWRVNGQLAVSRAIGDADFKPSVIATPDIQKVALDGGEDFVIIACDGLWDFVTDDLAAKEVYSAVCNNPDDAEGVSQCLVKLAKSRGSSDNISAIVVFLRDPSDVAADAQWLSSADSTTTTTTTTTAAAVAAAAREDQDQDLDNETAQPSAVTAAAALNESAAAMDAAGLDNANNPFANSNSIAPVLTEGEDGATTGEHVQKDPFLLDLDAYKQQATDINSVPNNDFFLLERSTNGKRTAEDVFGNDNDDDDDFGPETNVDNDGIDFCATTHNDNDNVTAANVMDEPTHVVSPTLLAAKAIAEGVNNSAAGLLERLEEEMEAMEAMEAMEMKYNKDKLTDLVEEAAGAGRGEAVTPPADDVHDGNLVDNVADSGDESEDEWNYFKGNAADTDKENIDPEKDQPSADLVGDDLDDAMSQLNPNAAEFVPVSPTRSTASPACMALINDTVYAQSPKRIPNEPVDIQVPEPNDFESEIRSRPSDVFNNGHAEYSEPNNKSSLEDMENLMNGKNAEDSEIQSAKSSENFHFGPNATPFSSTPAKLLLDESEAFSTKANFGDETTANFLDTTSSSFEKGGSASANNPFGDQPDFQSVLNKESDPMSMSFYQDKDDKSDTNPFDLNKVQMLPDDLDEFLSKPDENASAKLDNTISDLPEHEVASTGMSDDMITTDLDKPTHEEDLVGIRELPKSPIEDMKTPEPTFDENLCPNNEVIEKENIEDICEKNLPLERGNGNVDISGICEQIKDMTVEDKSFTESELEFHTKPMNDIPESFINNEITKTEPEFNIADIDQQEAVEPELNFQEQEQPTICVMVQQESGLIECNLIQEPREQLDIDAEAIINDFQTSPVATSPIECAISPEPIANIPISPEVCEIMSTNTSQPAAQLFDPEEFDENAISPVCQQTEYKSDAESPIDDITSSIKDDVSPVQLPPTDLIGDIPAVPKVDEEAMAAAVLAPELPVEDKAVPIVAAAAATAAVVVAAVGAKVATKTPKKPTTTKAATPKSAPRVASAKASATSPTKSLLATERKLTSTARSPAAKPPATKPATTTASKVTAAPRAKTAPAAAKTASDKKPLLNGESKTAPIKPPPIKQRIGPLPISKTAPVAAAKPAAVPAPRLTPTRAPAAVPVGTGRATSAPVASRTGVSAKPATGTAPPKPKPTGTSAVRATASKQTASSTVTKSTTTVSKTSTLTSSATNRATATKVTSSSTATSAAAAAPAKARVPITRAPPKAPDTEKQNKENVNKQTASRTAASARAAGLAGLTNGKPATTARKLEAKAPSTTAKTTVTKSTTATSTRIMPIKKPTASDPNRPLPTKTTKTVTTKTTTTSVPKPEKQNGLSNGLSTETSTTTTTIIESDLISVAQENTGMDNLVVKDNSPIMDNSQLINAAD